MWKSEPITICSSKVWPLDGKDSMLTFIPFAPPVPMRRVVMASRKSFARQSAAQCLGEVILQSDLPGCIKLIS